MLASLSNAGKWQIDITTNGICTDAIRSLCNAVDSSERRKLYFSISIDGMPETHNRIRQNSHAFEKAAESLKYLQCMNIPVKINTVIQEKNKDDLEAFAQYIFQQYGEVEIAWIPEVLGINGKEEFPYTDEEIARFIPYVYDEIGQFYLKTHGAARIRNCHAGIHSMVISPSGKVYTCLTGFSYKGTENRRVFCIGDLKKQSLDEIFLLCQDENSNARKAVNGCNGCWNPCEVSNELNFWKAKDIKIESFIDVDMLAIVCKESRFLEEQSQRYANRPDLSKCQVQIEAPSTLELAEIDGQTIPVTVINLSDDAVVSGKMYPINLAYHIIDKKGNMLLFDGVRTPIGTVIEPGAKVKMQMRVAIPPNLALSEEYICRITLVAEGCFWFDQEGENKKDILIYFKQND